MKYDNVKYFFFDENGEISEENEFSLGDRFSSFNRKIEFNLGTIKIQNVGEIVGSCDIFYGDHFTIKTKKGKVLSNDFFFVNFKISKKQYGAMIYHDGISEELAPYLFYDWYHFFLGERNRLGIHSEKSLSYVNKVYNSIKEKFPEYGQYHSESVINERGTISC